MPIADQIAALRADLGTIASAQITLLNDQAAREGRVLAEMRAIALARDPDLMRRLRRIEALLDRSAGEDGDLLDAFEDGQSDPASGDAAARPSPVPDGRLLSLIEHSKVPTARGDAVRSV